MGPNLCTAITGFHAFTGLDYTASFGKLGESSSVAPETSAELETYVCNMYQA